MTWFVDSVALNGWVLWVMVVSFDPSDVFFILFNEFVEGDSGRMQLTVLTDWESVNINISILKLLFESSNFLEVSMTWLFS